MDTTILCTTDNSLDEGLARVCREWLLKATNGHPIISVSQKPIDLGENICVGDIGRSWLSLHRQLLAGLKKVKTRYVAIAEHDCVYSEEHFQWVPPRDDVFYYNNNMWLLQWKGTKPEFNGMYSYWPNRYALSQLVCNNDLLLRTIDRRLNVIDKDRGLMKELQHVGEPGITEYKMKRVQRYAANGSHVYLRPMLKDFVEHLENEKAETFRTKVPNLDIRHGTNFTGPKRGKNRRWELAPWGKLDDIKAVR